MERENPLKFMACAAAALVAGVAFSAVSDTFEEGQIPNDWGTPDATIIAENISSVGGGFAIEGAAHAKVLSVTGEATRNSGIADTANQGQADFLVNISEASDADTFSNDSAPGGDVQIAIAAGTEIINNSIVLKIYCKPKSGSGLGAASWIDGPSVAVGAWHRISLVFDYVNRLCKVSVDGVPYVSASGFLKANMSSDTDKKGAWYGLANNPTDNKITSLSFVGAAKVDDVVIDAAETVTEKYSGDSSVDVDGLVVSSADLVKWGVDGTTINTVSLDDSRMTVAQKVVAGLDPTDGSTFTAKAMKMTDATTATIALPGGIKEGRTYTVKYTANDGTSGVLDATAGNGVLTVNNLPEKPVLKFTVEVSVTQNSTPAQD